MHGKKEMLAQVSAYSGATWVLELLPGTPSLLILNYHRVGEAERTPYDSGIFSATASEFAWQVGYLKRRFPIVTLPEAVEIVHGRSVPERTVVLLTFDDGYRDNFDEVFPVLRRHGVSATFFLPTAFIGTGVLPWWDVIAYLVKTSREVRVRLSYPEPAEFDLAPPARARSIMAILKLFKRPAMTDTERFLRELEAACGTTRPAGETERCFLSWEEARAMQRAGMCFGSHTHTHEILSRLSEARQVEELEVSREIMERELDRQIDTLAYPVGQPDTFSGATVAALEKTRYRTAFSFYSGVNRPGQIQPFDVRRSGVDGESRAVFRLRTTLRATTGRSLV